MNKKERARFLAKKLKSKKGFTLIEFMCVLAIIGLIAAMAVPQFTSMDKRAKEAVTVASMRATVSTIQGSMILYESENWYAPRTSWDSAVYSEITMNNYLEKMFENGSGPNVSYSYVNQYSGSRVILNWSNPISGTAENPAMFLTNSPQYAHAACTASSLTMLRGSIIVYFATQNDGTGLATDYIEVYYADENGVKSPDSLKLTM